MKPIWECRVGGRAGNTFLLTETNEIYNNAAHDLQLSYAPLSVYLEREKHLPKESLL